MLLKSAGRLSDVPELSNLTNKEIQKLMQEKGWSQSYLNAIVNSKFFTVKPNRDKDHDQTYIDWDTIGIDGYHKGGKNLVPRDNYRALLHKGEMVLNKRQADQYRRIFGKGYGKGGSLISSDPDYVGDHHSGYAGHHGIDLYFDEIGTPVGSAVAGTVTESRDILANWNDGKSYHGEDTNGVAYSSYGRYVKVLGDDGHTYIYAHLNERAVDVGDEVGPGTLLGYSGTTGNSSGPHLHFEVAGAGTGEAAHAAYYTPYVRNVTGAQGNSTSTISSNLSALKNTLGSKRYISKALSGSGGADNGTNRIVGSVDGGFNRLISYLDSISREQNEQRALLETYSLSKSRF